MKKLVGIKLGLPTKHILSCRMENIPIINSTYIVYSAVDWDGEEILGSFPLNQIIGKVKRHKVLAFEFKKKVINEIDTGKYIIRKELAWFTNDQDGKAEMESCYNYDDGYIGDIKTAKFICDKMGIAPEVIPDENNNVCCIGYRERDKKWYGWSHRAIQGFGIGDKIFEERYGNDHTYFNQHGSKPIKNYNDARLAAINFAKYIG